MGDKGKLISHLARSADGRALPSLGEGGLPCRDKHLIAQVFAEQDADDGGQDAGAHIAHGDSDDAAEDGNPREEPAQAP